MLHEDGGALGLAVLCKEMSREGLNVIISGGGADEIISTMVLMVKDLFTF